MGTEVPHPTPTVKGPRFLFQAVLGSGFFTGYFPFAPATVTSFFTLIPSYFLSRKPVPAIIVIGVIFFLGVWVADRLEKEWGKDPKRVTIDEVVGTFITFFLIPVSLFGLIVGFFLFRLFDILKLPFIKRVQNLRGGWGVMLDDFLAGICANLVLRVLVALFSVLRGV